MIKINSIFNYSSKIIKSNSEANVNLTKELDDITPFLILFCKDFRIAIKLQMSIISEET